MKTHLTLKSFSKLSVEEIIGNVSTALSTNSPVGSISIARVRQNNTRDWRGKPVNDGDGILHRHQAISIPSWPHGGLNE